MRQSSPIRRLRHGAQALVLLIAPSCHDSDVTYPPKGPSITLTPPNASIAVGDSVLFSATARLSGTFRWSTSAPAVVSVSDAGLARGLAPGRSTVTVVVGGLTGIAASALVEVRAP